MLLGFAQVVRHGGFSAAERATGERKAKLSRRVARLEQVLGVRLIERSTRNLRVTDVGREIYRQCETIAEGIDATQAIAARARSQIIRAFGRTPPFRAAWRTNSATPTHGS